MELKKSFADMFEDKKNTTFIIDGVINECPKCGSNILSNTRILMRGTGQADKMGLFCENCRALLLSK